MLFPIMIQGPDYLPKGGAKMRKLEKKPKKKKTKLKTNAFKLTKFLSSRGTPGALVDNLSFNFDGARENLILSPRLIT